MFSSLSSFWNRIQGSLFPNLEEELGPLTEKQQQLVSTLEIIRIEEFITRSYGETGRPQKDRAALARAFVAKAIYNMPTTRMLIERLKTDLSLCRICGWETRMQIPAEATFSRAYAEFSESELVEKVHTALVKKVYDGKVVGHVSRDSTAIEGREKAAPKEKKEQEPRRKRGRPKKGEERPKKEKRLDKQLKMTQEERLHDLPKQCDTGAKANSKGNRDYWEGYKFHIDTADGDVPLGCILTSASLHDSQVAIPLAEETAKKVTSLYDLMDAAYDCPQIKEHSVQLGHVALIDPNVRRDKVAKAERKAEAKARQTINWVSPEHLRYRQRTASERVNSRLKDDFGGKMVRVRGHLKVACHLMFGILALTADALLNLVR